MSGLIKGRARVLAVLSDLEQVDVEGILIDVARLYGLSVRRLSADSERSRRDQDADRRRSKRGQSAVQTRTGEAQGTSALVSESVGGKGGSLISDLQSGSPLQSPTLSSLGSPTPVEGSTAENGGAETSEVGATMAGGRAQYEPALSSRAEAPTGPGATSELQAHSSPAEAPKSRASLTGVTASGAQASGRASAEGHGEAQSAVPIAPRRFNADALVQHFVEGVNRAGGTWPCPSGKPHTDLTAALNLHAHTPPAAGAVLAWMTTLGRRWYAYCGGAPRKAWAAAEWLGEGAPERPRAPGEATPLDAAKERAARIRRTREATAREEAYEREKAQRGPPPPEIQAQMAALWSPPAPPPASGKQRAWTPELDEQVKELASGGDE